MNKNNHFIVAVFEIVNQIPIGKVMTYGDIAHCIGYPKKARMVGAILSKASLYGDYPCHRVVNFKGRLVPGWDKQRELLIQEGIEFNGEFVDMKKYRL